MSDDVREEAEEVKREAGAKTFAEFVDSVGNFDRGTSLKSAAQNPVVMGDVPFTGARLKQWAAATRKSSRLGRDVGEETVLDLLAQQGIAGRHISHDPAGLPLGVPGVVVLPEGHPAGAGPVLQPGTTGALNAVLTRWAAKQAYQKKTELFPLLHAEQVAHNANLRTLMASPAVMSHDFIKEEKEEAQKGKILSGLIDKILAQRARDVRELKRDLGIFAFAGLCLCTGLGVGIGLGVVSSASAAAPTVGKADAIMEKGMHVGGAIGLAIGFLLVAILIYRGLRKLNAPENPLSRHDVSVADMQTYLDQKQTAKMEAKVEADARIAKDAAKTANEQAAKDFLAALRPQPMTTPLVDMKHSPTAAVNSSAERKQQSLDATLTMAVAVEQPKLMGDKPFTGARLKRWKEHVGEETCQAFLRKTSVSQRDTMDRFVSLREEQVEYDAVLETNLQFLMAQESVTGHEALSTLGDEPKRTKLRGLLDKILLKREESNEAKARVWGFAMLAVVLGSGIGGGKAVHDAGMGILFGGSAFVAILLTACIVAYAQQKFAGRDLATCPIGPEEMTEKLGEPAADNMRTPLLGSRSSGEAQ